MSSSASVSVIVLATSNNDQCDNLWKASAVYVGGNQVTWAGKVWEAKWWTQGDDPAQSGVWGVWKEIGVADCATQ
ncbi:carbohydrate-binding protein [Vibrio sp. A8-1]|uniref:carbohydrate-binding protein n=1 Tax=Vibrio sp. A8-1 TaxID=2591023 RepID=UPI002017F86A|nr:carbohydrate-binding protein [Vibrio sp. A8-1]